MCRDTATRLSAIADEVLCAEAPVQFVYQNFSQTTDDQVFHLLERGRAAAKGVRA